MPFYNYRCLDCDSDFYVQHSMSEDWTSCEICNSENIIKVVATMDSKIDSKKYKSKVGDLVRSHIEESTNQVKKEKQKLKEKEY